MKFSGSYRPIDVEFLLKPLKNVVFHDVLTKEELIQNGTHHYSELISMESLPSPNYLNIFNESCELNFRQMASDCLRLASIIAEQHSGAITLVSLVRGGTPIGVILNHVLRVIFKRDVYHFSISIIKDRGIDQVALDYILSLQRKPESIVFVDGWTGKGTISKVLKNSIDSYNNKNKTNINNGLYVLNDLAGTAFRAASNTDYLIPSSILNSTISGLISRSILNNRIGPDDFHGCVYYDCFKSFDISISFVEKIIAECHNQLLSYEITSYKLKSKSHFAVVSSQYLDKISKKYGILDLNYIKPGIGEATRVLLRRVPEFLILRDLNSSSITHLKILAKEKKIPIIIDPELPYEATSIINRQKNNI